MQRLLLKLLGLFKGEEGDEDVGPSKHNTSQASSSKEEEDKKPSATFYGVYYLGKDSTGERTPVFTTKRECLIAIKKHKGSRFKTFSSYDEAFRFSETGPPFVEPSEPDSEDEKLNNANKAAMAKLTSSVPLFKGVTSQERVAFRKTVEFGRMDKFEEFITANPRFLVSSSDNPAIVQEGCRYNVVHVACMKDKPEMLAKILKETLKPDLFRLLYPEDEPATTSRRFEYLFDNYLNMPDKSANETPLHFAAKVGSVGCVRLLTSFPSCFKFAKNKYDKMPVDVVMDKYSGPSHLKETIQLEIMELLEPHYYVPVLRDPSFSLPPIVGSLWCPEEENKSFEFAEDLANTSLKHLHLSVNRNNSISQTPVDLNVSMESSQNWRNASFSSPMNCSRKVEALLGPVTKKKAEEIRLKWRKATRLPRTPASPLFTSPITSSPIQHSNTKDILSFTPTRVQCSTPASSHRQIAQPDYQKGLEVIGRQLAKECNTNWTEFWDFFGDFVDLKSKEGRVRLEKYLKDQYHKVSDAKSFNVLSEVNKVLVALKDEGYSEAENNGGSKLVRDSESSVMSVCESSNLVEDNNDGSSTPNVSKRSRDSLDTLCKGLEAIRLNASLSPGNSHYSPAAERRYNELSNAIKMDTNVMTLSFTSSFNNSRLNLTAEELDSSLRSNNWQLISYVVQSCKITASKISGVFEDLASDYHDKMLPQLTLVRYVKVRILGEISALHVIINRCCIDHDTRFKSAIVKDTRHKVLNNNLMNNSSNHNDMKTLMNDTTENISMESASLLEKSVNESGVSIIHGLLALEVLKLLIENLIPGELLFIIEQMRVLIANLDYMEIASSDDEDDENASNRFRQMNYLQEQKKDHSVHMKCVIQMLERALSLATKNGHNERSIQVPSVKDLHNCHCDWGICCSTLAALAEYAESGCKKNGVIADENSNEEASGKNSLFRKLLFKEDVPECEQPSDVDGNCNTLPDTKQREQIDGNIGIIGSATIPAEEVPLPADQSDVIVTKADDSGNNSEGSNEEAIVAEENTYATAPPSTSSSEMETPEDIMESFIQGPDPSKTDLDVLVALGDEPIDEHEYPYTAQWQHLVNDKQKQSVPRSTGSKVRPTELFQSPYCLKPKRIIDLSSCE